MKQPKYLSNHSNRYLEIAKKMYLSAFKIEEGLVLAGEARIRM